MQTLVADNKVLSNEEVQSFPDSTGLNSEETIYEASFASLLHDLDIRLQNVIREAAKILA